MAAVRAAPARDAETGTPRARETRREHPESRVPPVVALRTEDRDEGLVALRVPPGSDEDDRDIVLL